MTAKLTRRSFLKGSLGAACATLGAAVPAGAGLSEGGGHLATLIDIRKCVGCEECVAACSEANRGKYPNPKKPFPKMYPARVPVMDWSDRQDVGNRLTPYNWLFIQRAEVEIDGDMTELSIPRRCMHCVNPPCVKLCPWGAAKQLTNGLSRIDSDICLGGSKCKAACPWLIPERQTGVGLYLDILPSLAGNGVMYKCDRCYDRIQKGDVPACIEACPEGVQIIGPRDEIISRAHALAKKRGDYIYGEKENGGTNTIYLSPVPFGELDSAIKKGKGMPHLNPVEDSMASGNKLAVAMLIAPLAGFFGALGKVFKGLKQAERGHDES